MHNNISILSINKFIRLSLKIDGFFIPILKKEVIYNGKKENARPAPGRYCQDLCAKMFAELG